MRNVFSRANRFSKGSSLTLRRGGWLVEMSGNEHLDHHSVIQRSDDSRRFEGRFARIFALWAVMKILYWLGASPNWLGRMYKPLR